jgi:hypothetical protein
MHFWGRNCKTMSIIPTGGAGAVDHISCETVEAACANNRDVNIAAVKSAPGVKVRENRIQILATGKGG